MRTHVLSHGQHVVALICFGVAASGSALAQAQPPSLAPPPRTITDITAILEQEKPHPNRAARMRAVANASPPAGVTATALAQFYYDRGQKRAGLGRYSDAIADGEKAIEIGKGQIPIRQQGLIRQFIGLQYRNTGNPKKALEVFNLIVQETNQPGSKGRLMNTYRLIAEVLISLGDLRGAEEYVRRAHAQLQQLRHSPNYPNRGVSWEGDAAYATALVKEARGQFRDAENSYRQAEGLRRKWVIDSQKVDFAPPKGQVEASVDRLVVDLGRVKARQGRVLEGEADIRRALLSRLRATGKYNVGVARTVGALAKVLVEQGRMEEAEQLARTAVDIYRDLGFAEDSDVIAAALNEQAAILNLQGQWQKAEEIYAIIAAATTNWEPGRKEALILTPERVYTLYSSNNIPAGIAAAERLVALQRARYGEQSVQTAFTRGLLAIGFARAGRNADALREFRLAVPILVSAARETDGEDAIDIAAREQRVQQVVEAYMTLLARMPPQTRGDVAAETFRLAETIRGRSVQKALAQSGARAVVRDPRFAELIRKAQDLEKQIGAQLSVLNNVLALSPEQRDDKAVRELTAEIEKLRSARLTAHKDIEKRLPSYADLIDPRPPTLEGIRGFLRPDETLLSFYFGRDSSFVWAVPEHGPVAFAPIPATAGDLETKVRKLREALDPNAHTIGDIPAFDIAAAHQLYRLLLEPVVEGWRSAKSLIVVTNGALGLLPLSLLPTAPADVKGDEGPLFALYRTVPWLARTHAVTMVPSAAALRTLRQLPVASDKRDKFIGFGDPFFYADQAAEAQRQAHEASSIQVAAATGRGLPFRRRATAQTRLVDSADLAQLPRLPDTADELRSIALLLQTDPAKVLYLGKDANERRVKEIDLSRFRIVAFATHGLVPGDLNGLTQPALALTAPNIADVDGDGLLTMEEVLSLKLDSDWVVLSACNTAAGAGRGAEAVSGLGRAFFYAGSRALLVTSWPVHSESARELVSDIFRRQASNAKLTRADALRQAMMGLMDGPGFADGGKTHFTYAHPLFWAPYTIIGDGGGQ